METSHLSYDLVLGSDIMPWIKIDKPLVVLYLFWYCYEMTLITKSGMYTIPQVVYDNDIR